MGVKKRIVVAIFALCAIFACVCVMGSPLSLQFNYPEGFYNEDIDLKFNYFHFGKIYYTLDGSEPTPNSIKYKGKIELTNASELVNGSSMRTDHSPGFNSELLQKYGYDVPGYKAPNYNIDKAYHVRAALYDFFGKKYDEVDGMYFVNLSQSDMYKNMAVASITTDKKNLWDYDTGIYTGGRKLREYEESISGANAQDECSHWESWPANYRDEGKSYERKCKLKFFDESKNLLLSQDCGIRIQGATSRANNQKGFSIFARKEYSTKDVFEQDLTNSGYLQDKYVLTAGGQDVRCKMSDYIIQDAIKDYPVGSVDMRPCILFLNGEFWGMYWLQEPYNTSYFNYHYGINSRDLLLFKNCKLKEGKEADSDEYKKMFDWISENDMTKKANYKKACQMIDIDNYAAYEALMLYVRRIGDWPENNEICWKTTSTDKKNTYADGRWRWVVFDFNSRSADVEWALDVSQVDNIQDLTCDSMLRSLYLNPDFKRRMSGYLQKLAFQDFKPEKMDSIINEYYSRCLLALYGTNKRFFGDEAKDDIMMNVANKKYYFARRHDICREIIIFLFGEEYLWAEWDE